MMKETKTNIMVFLPWILIFFILFSPNIRAQSNADDSATIKKIFDTVLSKGRAYENLRDLCTVAPSRLSGSIGAEAAVQWTKETLKKMGAEKISLQEVMVPVWKRGEPETAWFEGKNGKTRVRICALGGSVATTGGSLNGKIIEIKNLEDLKTLGPEEIKGKIVFFNHPMDPTEAFAFNAYGKAVKHRWAGPSEAARYGAIGTICRSMTHALDTFPHTGAMKYNDSLPKIPCAAISTVDAELLSKSFQMDSTLDFGFRMTCQTLPDTKSYNVLGEIKGTDYPDEIIVAGGHLDAWDNGEGAHDDGAGIVQTMEVIHVFKTLGIKPKRTIRFVAFMNEENGLMGGKKYAALVKEFNEKHLIAIESDAGGGPPRGFSLAGDENSKQRIRSFRELLEPYGVYDFSRDGGGADIGPLKEQGVFLMGLEPDPQQYFDFHHTANDVFRNIHKRELEMGAGAISSMIYLVDKYGL